MEIQCVYVMQCKREREREGLYWEGFSSTDLTRDIYTREEEKKKMIEREREREFRSGQPNRLDVL